MGRLRHPLFHGGRDRREWERAARGADARIFPHGFTLRPDEGNIDTTYNKDLHAVGADVVGSYPQTNSPFNIEDMVGNAFEWTTSNLTESGYVARGGGFFFNEITARATNRAVVPPNIRDSQLGIRLCAPFDAESSR